MKQSWKPGTVLYPLPAVLVSCGAAPEEYNMLTVAWTGTVCSDPPMCFISVRPERHSHAIISRTGEFVVNLTTRRLARAADWCGVRSGRDFDKFREMGLTAVPSEKVAAPLIAESPAKRPTARVWCPPHRMPCPAGAAARDARHVPGRGGRRSGRRGLHRSGDGAVLP